MVFEISLEKIVEGIYLKLASKYEINLEEPYTYFYKRVTNKIKNDSKIIDSIKSCILQTFYVNFDDNSLNFTLRQVDRFQEDLLPKELSNIFEQEYLSLIKTQKFIKESNFGNLGSYLDDEDTDIIYDLCSNYDELEIIKMVLDMYHFYQYVENTSKSDVLEKIMHDIVIIDPDEYILEINDSVYKYLDKVLHLKFASTHEFDGISFLNLKQIYKNEREKLKNE